MKQPRVGVACLIVDDGRLLLGRRNKKAESFSWQLPGGYMAAGESVFEAAVRLAREKAEVRIRPVQQGPCTNNVFQHSGLHTVTLYVLAELQAEQINEKLANDWQWFHPHDLPQPLFYPLQLLCDQHADWLNQSLY